MCVRGGGVSCMVHSLTDKDLESQIENKLHQDNIQSLKYSIKKRRYCYS